MPQGVEPVDNFDLQRYLGRWYEIARLDHSFERGMEAVTVITQCARMAAFALSIPVAQ